MTQVVCNRCGTTNRVADGRDLLQGKCGRCGMLLFDGVPFETSATVFGKQIAKSDVPVLLDVWAPWCGPCKVMAPHFEAAAKDAEPEFRFLKLNSEENRNVAGRLGIRGIPKMILFAGGREIARVSGAMSTSDILAWARSNRRG